MSTGGPRFSIAPFAGGTGACQLCATAPAQRTTVVVVQDAGGDAALFLACDGCARAAHRLAAVAGATAPTRPGSPVPTQQKERRREPRAAPPELIHAYAEPVVGADGTCYVARARGVPRRDGTWVGWLEFAAPGTGRALRTGRETTQPSRVCLAYWATGIAPVYMHGALARARPRNTPVARGSLRGGG
ncbi:MAG TPA: hypothetical protein VG370_10860 [Chloroflexota bacterium]|jgi:hypothetical protein|nr:hypothetical protein [Chloroflexota bacterium]